MEWAARAIGVFYVLGGLMLLYQAWLNWRLQRALSGVIAVPADDQIADGVIALGGVVPFLSFIVERKIHRSTEAELAANPKAAKRY